MSKHIHIHVRKDQRKATTFSTQAAGDVSVSYGGWLE